MENLSLDQVPIGTTVLINHIDSDITSDYRFAEIGILPGSKITALISNPFKDPVGYYVKGTIIAIRKNDAKKIKVSLHSGDYSNG